MILCFQSCCMVSDPLVWDLYSLKGKEIKISLENGDVFITNIMFSNFAWVKADGLDVILKD